MKKYNREGKEVGETKSSKYIEAMNKDKRKADEAYIENQRAIQNIQRIIQEGISNVEDLTAYLHFVIEDARHMEDIARQTNNNIIYSETIAVKREFLKLLELVFKDGSAAAAIDGTEEAHREGNDGSEGYA